ncbi:fumarylacetoacetate hydrolase domain-containing protein 2-like [Sycon ciliatum]|uniref:fumarylacetoacetate hydrolase domain-containing protein 2-like n=1 Tax=Sycon ciliatum TaxID=27933 RepID=UPI0020AD04F2|eukprot:scpid83336/ scgid23088/ Fumarylacetoacetate hydrolase domain-containing protein 2
MAEPASKVRPCNGLRLLQFEKDGVCRVGVEAAPNGDIVDVTRIDSSIPTDMVAFLEAGEAALDAAAAAVATGEGVLGRDSVKIRAPLFRPEKVICVGMNYVDHCTEQNMPVPVEPVIFSKFASAIVDPNADVELPPETEELDFEVELAFVIGRGGRRIQEEDAMSHVAGFTVAHDVSARDWQLRKNGGQWLIGKTFDTFCPIGPSIVPPSALSDVHNLGIRCRLNGETVQDSNTNQLVHKTQACISFISKFITLKPGDLILTGTPPGVGCFRKPPLWLKKGDVVECEIDEIGCIRNLIV